jgi:hypothetical protein
MHSQWLCAGLNGDERVAGGSAARPMVDTQLTRRQSSLEIDSEILAFWGC